MAFKETIKQKIREAALTQFGDDVIKYLIYVKNNLCLITSSMQAANTHGDLLTYLFQQLESRLRANAEARSCSRWKTFQFSVLHIPFQRKHRRRKTKTATFEQHTTPQLSAMDDHTTQYCW